MNKRLLIVGLFLISFAYSNDIIYNYCHNKYNDIVVKQTTITDDKGNIVKNWTETTTTSKENKKDILCNTFDNYDIYNHYINLFIKIIGVFCVIIATCENFLIKILGLVLKIKNKS